MGRDDHTPVAIRTSRRFQSTLPAWGETPSPVSSHRREIPFQSTLPAWGETGCGGKFQKNLEISIHSPRMGRDRRIQHAGIAQRAFQSTLPAWGETAASAVFLTPDAFQSTLPAWGETGGVSRRPPAAPISIHSPRMGRDRGLYGPILAKRISIHSPRMGRDSKRTQLFEEKNWRICTTLYLFASKGVLPADKKTF